MVQESLFQFSEITRRLRVIGMPRYALQKLTGLGETAIRNMLSGRLYGGKLANVCKVAEALGLEVKIEQKLAVEHLLARYAGKKAQYIVEQWAKATYDLHGKIPDAEEERTLRKQIVHNLLTGKRQELWRESTPIDDPGDFVDDVLSQRKVG